MKKKLESLEGSLFEAVNASQAKRVHGGCLCFIEGPNGTIRVARDC